ncbi:MAG TPA: discoidin domain-containing protein, partial [Thermoguttaceae bacterium]|nr:discoidin domain-containing protein [Thermoguttaceae bacterium]
LTEVGANLALSADVSVSHSMDIEKCPPQRINDGPCETLDNNRRWLGDGPLPHRIEFVWPKPQPIGAVRIVSGYREPGGRTVGPIEDFVIERLEQGEWKPISTTKTVGNENADWHARFPAVTADRVRLTITKTHTGVSRIWEVEFYPGILH